MIDSPEYNVVVATLRQAITDATTTPTASQVRQKGAPGLARDRDDAIQWIADDSARPWSFRWCCDMVGLDHQVVRHCLESSPHQVRQRLREVRRVAA